MDKRKINRGDIFYAYLNQSETERFVLVVQNNISPNSQLVVVVPITKSNNKNQKKFPTHVSLPKASGLEKGSIIISEQIKMIDSALLSDYIGEIGEQTLLTVDIALSLCVGLNSHWMPKGKILTLCLCQRCVDAFWEGGYVLSKKGWQANKAECDFCKTGKGFTYGVFKTEHVT